MEYENDKEKRKINKLIQFQLKKYNALQFLSKALIQK